MPVEDGLYTDPVLVLEPGMHTARINNLDADAGGHFLVTASHDKTVRVWAAEDGALLQTIRLPAGPGNVGKAHAAAMSPDGKLVAAGGWTSASGTDESVYVFDRASGRLLRWIGGLPGVIHHLAFSPDGQKLAATLGGKNGVRLIDPATGRVAAEDRGYGGPSLRAAFDRAGRLATTSIDGKVRLYGPDLRLLKTVAAPALSGKQPFGIAFSLDGARLAVGYEDTVAVEVLEATTLGRLFAADTIGVEGGSLSEVAWSVDGSALLAAGRWYVGSKLQARSWAEGGRGAHTDLPLSRNAVMGLRGLAGERLAFTAADPWLGVLGADGREAWSRGPPTADFRNQRDQLAVSADGERVAFGYEYEGRAPAMFSLAGRRLATGPASAELVAVRTAAPGLAIEGWEGTREPTLNGERLALDKYERSQSLAIAPDSRRFVLGTEWSLRLFGRESGWRWFGRDGREVWRRDVLGTVWAVNVTGDGRLLVAAYGDGTIRWHRLSDGAELLALYPHADRERWVLWTPRGHYAASPGGEDLIGWQVNRGRDEAPEFYTASRFRDRFHRPDVIDLVLAELDVDAAAVKADAAAEWRSGLVGRPVIVSRAEAVEVPPPATPQAVLTILPPTVAITNPQEGAPATPGELIVTYIIRTPETDPPAEVKALLDGERAGGAVLPTSAPAQSERHLIVTVPAGASLLTLLARNAQGWSDPVTVRFERAASPAAPTIIHEPTATLYALAVGVNRYERYPHLALNYAVADAADLCNVLRLQEGGLYRRVQLLPLVDEDATWEGVLDGFESLKRDMTPEDVAMVLLSGHGMNDAEGVFHFLPHDANIAKPMHVRRSCIGHDYLKDTLRTLADRGKTLLFLDACHSGGLIPGTRAVPPDIGAVANDLAGAENGVIVFASCTGGQVSFERPEWENGAMTEALLEALAGKARRDGDRLLVSDIADYVKARVRDLTAGEQTPVALFPQGRYTNPPVYMLR